jgi:RHS repeat-associated protein
VHAKDPYGNTEQYVYDERGFIVELQRSGKPPIRVRRNELMQVISVTEGPRETQFVHDYWGRLLSVRAADGTSVRFQYNRRGDLILQVDPRGHVTRFEYDPEGNLVGVLAPDGSVRRARYGGENWITEVTDARGLTTKVLYDNEGEVVECINERGERFVFDYDLGGRVTATHTFDGRTIRYAYTRGGLLKRTIEADGSTILFEHDAVGNLIEMSAPSGSERYEYDSLDFIIAAQNDWSKVTFKRDLCGRVTNEILEFAGARYEVESRYDANGARIGWRAGQREVAFDFDSAGQLLARVFDGSRRQELQHDVMGRLTGWSYPTGVRAQLGYEAGGMLSGLRVLKPKGVRGIDVGLTEAAGEQAVLWRSFEYSVTNELVRVLDMTAGETRFAYDAFGQLLQRATARTQEVFSYDVTRNVSPAGAPAVVGPGNRLLALGTTELTWDAAGRLATKKQRVDGAERVWQYRWQATGFLEEVTDPDGVVWAFEYDPFGRRTRKWSSQGDEVHFAWDGNALAMERRQRADGSVDERTYLFEEDDATFPVAQHANGKWFDYVTSPIGTPTELVDDTGEIGWAATLKAFGEVEDERAVQTDTPLRFPGQYADRETGLHYNRFRYYDPELGRFISPDPTSIEGNIHEWAYARNPIGWVDPLGFEDGAALAKGMGSNPPPGFAAHHVIPESLFKDPKIQGLLGKDPHTKQNGIHLPGSQEAHDAHKASKKPPKPPAKTIHKGGHAGYTKAVKKKLLAIAKDKNLSPSQKQKKAKELQKQIQKELQDGTFEFQNTSGKTVSGVNKNGTVG